MKIKLKLLTIILVTIALLLVTCKKDNVVSNSEETFCSYVNEKNFDATGSIIDNFLGTLKNNDENGLEKLKNWLDSKSCINKSEIVCNSCIYTNPPSSQIKIKFNVKGQIVELTLSILMDAKLKFLSYH